MTEIQATVRDAAAAGGSALLAPAIVSADRPMDEDAEFAELPPRRHVPALTKLLIVGIAMALSFAGGVLVQKRHDTSLTSAAAIPGLAGGIPAFVSGAGAAGGGSSAAVSGPVLVGTVVGVAGADITVKDLGGTTHVVHTSATTGLATTGVDLSVALPPGATVSVEGTKAADGTVTATTVTRR